jgi:Zn-dependent protease
VEADVSYLDPHERIVQRAPRGTFRPSPIFLGIVAVFVIAGVLTWADGNRGSTLAGFEVFLFVIFGWLMSLCLHEFAHAVVAYRAGDITVAQRGYLQLNPLKYTHWLFSIALPLLFIMAGGIALPGGAVLVNHAYVRNRAKETAISLAGPATNLLCAAILVAPFAAGVDLSNRGVFWSAAALLAFFQLMAGIFNLLPIPGLDGGGAIRPWLSQQWQRGYASIAPFGFIIIVLLLWQTSFGQSLINGMYHLLAAFGVPTDAVGTGLALFRFWQG